MFLSKRPNPTKEKPGAEAILLNDPNTTTNLWVLTHCLYSYPVDAHLPGKGLQFKYFYSHKVNCGYCSCWDPEAGVGTAQMNQACNMQSSSLYIVVSLLFFKYRTFPYRRNWGKKKKS